MTSDDRARQSSGRLPYFLGAAVLVVLLMVVGIAAQRASQSQLNTLRHEIALLELERQALTNELESERLISARTLEALRQAQTRPSTAASTPVTPARVLLVRATTDEGTSRGAIAIAGDIGVLRLDQVPEQWREERLELWRVSRGDAVTPAQERLAPLPTRGDGSVEVTFHAVNEDDRYEIRSAAVAGGDGQVLFTST